MRGGGSKSCAFFLHDLPARHLTFEAIGGLDIQAAYGFKSEMPRWQIVKEKRATFAATPAQDALRPGNATSWDNLFLAGDWTQTGLPATIEGALRSGETAARLVVGAQAR